jgi:RNA polymerase sigma factor (sigma-70 family)
VAAGTKNKVSALASVQRRASREPTSDAQLVRGVRDGSVTAFEAIFDRYHRRILAFCRHMLGSLEDGEDATQHVFVAAHRDLQASSKDVELRPWLFAIARNRCVDMLRSRRATDSLDTVAHDPPALDGLPEVVQRREDLRALVADIGALPEAQRAALVLFELGGLSQRKLAEVLDCRPEQVKALVFQARTSLMADRQAREAACQGIREEIAAGRGHDLLRSQLRRHLRVCPACRAFADETRHQRAALALVLPVLPTAGLKASTLAAAGVGAAGPVAGGMAGGLGGALGKGVALKALAILGIAGAAGGIGYTLLHRATVVPAASATERQLPVARSAAIEPAGRSAAVANPAAGSRQRASHARRRGRRGAATRVRRHAGRRATGGRLGTPALSRSVHARAHGLRRVSRRHASAPVTTHAPTGTGAPTTQPTAGTLFATAPAPPSSRDGASTPAPSSSTSLVGEPDRGHGHHPHPDHPDHPAHPVAPPPPAQPQAEPAAGQPAPDQGLEARDAQGVGDGALVAQNRGQHRGGGLGRGGGQGH